MVPPAASLPHPIRKVLVANRGEIALRVIRACREMGIRSVAVHSDVDAEALHVKFADESVCIGPAAPRLSYLNAPAVLSAAEITGADAIHPGYGFLAENPDFADLCRRCGLIFVGPPGDLMRLLGNKVSARAAMARAGVPILPGTTRIETDEQALQGADAIGYPVIIKASAGGGGRGMKIVQRERDLLDQLRLARSEAQAGFGSADVYLESYLEAPRHIEVQVVADGHEGVVALGERECSIQRRHQKLVEEAPAPGLDEEKRAELFRLCEGAMRQIGYHSLGTLEFLMDEAGNLSFMEMNTRIQVEHTVTEMVVGLDLVRLQLRLAQGGTMLPTFSRRLTPRGHAIECRINAEDPQTFAPSPGRITALNLPGGLGVRVDTHIYEGYVVPPHYDSLLAKLIVHAEDREAARRRLRRALHEFVIEGPRTNLDLHRRIVDHPDFVEGKLDTRFLDRLR